MTRNYATQRIERMYGALAYTSAIAVLAVGGMLIALAMRREIVYDTWQIILVCMLVPVLSAIAWSCGNYRENARVRMITSVVFVPLGLVNPLMWLCALIILRRRSVPSASAGTISPRPLLQFRHVRPVRQPIEVHAEEHRW
jgi:hypothetical protein